MLKHRLVLYEISRNSPGTQCRNMNVRFRPNGDIATSSKWRGFLWLVMYAEPDDVDKWLEILESPATEEAMNYDGVKRDTVKVFVLDKEFRY